MKMTRNEYRQMGKETIERLYKEQDIEVDVLFSEPNAYVFIPSRKHHFEIYHGKDIYGNYVFEVQTFSIGTINPLQTTDEILLMQAFGIFFTNREFAEAVYEAVYKLDKQLE